LELLFSGEDFGGGRCRGRQPIGSRGCGLAFRRRAGGRIRERIVGERIVAEGVLGGRSTRRQKRHHEDEEQGSACWIKGAASALYGHWVGATALAAGRGRVSVQSKRTGRDTATHFSLSRRREGW